MGTFDRLKQDRSSLRPHRHQEQLTLENVSTHAANNWNAQATGIGTRAARANALTA